MRFLTTTFFALLLVACGTKQEDNAAAFIQPKVVEAKGYVVPKDSVAEPVVILVDESKLTKSTVDEPKVIPIDTNVHLAGEPKIFDTGEPLICIPGQDTFAMPITVPVIDSSYAAGIPEIVIAKDAEIIDINSVSFSAFTAKQGLKRDEVFCMLHDKKGNLWFGMSYGGVSKYDGKNFTHYTGKEGLSSNTIRSIFEDSSGNIWFGTHGDGAIKYDGKTFTKYAKGQGLIDDTVLAIMEDSSGNLWIATFEGVSKFDGKSFTHYTSKEGLLCNYYGVVSMLEDSHGNMWFGSKGMGVSKFDGKAFYNYTVPNVFGSHYFSSFFEDSSGILWCGAWDGLWKFDGKRFIHYDEDEGLISRFVTTIKGDSNGNLWIGTWHGISKYDGSSFTNYSFSEVKEDYNGVNSILSDWHGNLWFGTKGGILKFGGNSFKNFTKDEVLTEEVKSMYEDENGSLWFSGYGEVVKYDGKSLMNAGLPDGCCVSKDKAGKLWFGMGSGAFRLDGEQLTHFREREGLCDWYIPTIIGDKSGNVWFAPYHSEYVYKYDGKSFTHYTEKQGLINGEVNSILADNTGNIWFGTSGGVSKYDGTSFTNYSEKEGLSDNKINSILEDRSGNLWFGTAHGGVTKFDGKFFTHYDEKVGMSNDFIYGLCQDRKGNIYIGSRYDLKVISQEKLKELDEKIAAGTLTESEGFFREIGLDNGFLGAGINEGQAIMEDRNGTIWIGSSDRLTAYNPNRVIKDTLAPNIQLTGIDLFNQTIPWPLLTDKQDSALVLKNGMRVADYSFNDVSRWYSIPENLSLAYNNNYVTFNFIGITMNQPKRVKYQYKLEGLDENWSEITSVNAATYGNMEHGTYTFLVKAMNSEGVWSEPFQYTFTIRPPWWKTWWAYGLYVLIGLVSISTYLRWRDRMAIKRRKVLQQKVTAATTEIRLQKEEVEKQKQRSDELLLNILPEQVAEELKERGEAEAKLMDNVTVLFTDFKGFTTLSEKLTPQQLVSQIHEYFSAFDAIIVKYGIEKIKTIGDAYMAAGGLPEMNETHARDVIMAAMEINAYMMEQRQKRQAKGEPFFEIRIGVHTGPVVAGIVGVKKFQYDIWGDTVNTASRMESSGEPGKINISESTFELIKDRYTCEYRGEIDAKGKGKMRMYFVLDVVR